MKILFITHTRIGDAVLSSGILRRLVDIHPDASFTVACGPLASSLFSAVPRLDRVIVIEKQPYDLHWFKLWRELRKTPWDLVIDLRRSLVSYFVSARERRILGPADDKVHRVTYLSSVLGKGELAPPSLFTDARHADAAARLIPPGPPVLAISPVAATVPKTWPARRFADVVEQVTFMGIWRLAVFGAPADRAIAQPLLDRLGPATILVFNQTDLLTVHAALGRCAGFIGNDSGLAHLAAAANIPTLALFGPTDPVRYAPWGAKAATLRAPSHAIESLEPPAVTSALIDLLARCA